MLTELVKDIPSNITAVKYKFKIPELAELFETYSPEQTHIALEGAFNIIFGQAGIDESGLAAEGEDLQSDEQNQIDHEAQIVNDVAFALFAHEQGKFAEGNGIVEFEVSDDPQSSPLYQELEANFRTIVDRIATALAGDKFNQDITTLHGEMQFFRRLELYTYTYDTKSEVLAVTVTATM